MFGPITYVMLANSRNPASFTSFTPLQHLAEEWMTKPASAWPTGDLLVPPTRTGEAAGLVTAGGTSG